MRFLLQAEFCTDTANEAIRDGSLGETIRSILDGLKTATIGIATGTERLGLAVVGAILAFLILTLFGWLERELIANHLAGKAESTETPPHRPEG